MGARRAANPFLHPPPTWRARAADDARAYPPYILGLHATARAVFMTRPQDAVLAALMEAAQGGDGPAYQALLRACAPVAAATARRTGIPPDKIDDVVQETLLTIHRARATYDPARPFLPWLRAIAQRRAIDALRIHGRGAAHETADEIAYINHPGTAPHADDVVDSADQTAMLTAAIATLPPGQRQAIELLALKERSLEEAATITGRNKGALKVNLHRAIHALRARLKDTRDV